MNVLVVAVDTIDSIDTVDSVSDTRQAQRKNSTQGTKEGIGNPDKNYDVSRSLPSRRLTERRGRPCSRDDIVFDRNQILFHAIMLAFVFALALSRPSTLSTLSTSVVPSTIVESYRSWNRHGTHLCCSTIVESARHGAHLWLHDRDGSTIVESAR